MSGKLKEIEVVAAVICSGGRFLVCQRKEDATFPLKWEFAGGKVEPGEGPLAALQRELKEELCIEIETATEIYRHTHAYEEQLKVKLIFFRVDQFVGVATNRVFQQLLWVELKRLDDFDFLEGNWPLIHKLIRREL